MPVYSIQRDPAQWTNPDAFVPERFESKMEEPSEKAAHDALAWMPFSSGPRICIGTDSYSNHRSMISHGIGLHMAMLEMKIVLSMLFQKFSFEETEPFSLAQSVMLKPKPDVRLVVKQRVK